jgi:hypothetical protein
MRKFICITILILSGCAGIKWVKIGDSSADGGYNIYADPATVSRSGNLAKIWELNDYKTAQVSATGPRYMSSRTQMEYDCKEARMRQLLSTRYTGNMGEGEIAYVEDAAAGTWKPVPANSAAANNRKIACDRR